ncbi:MAG: hypothetical protein H6733_07270 [Alphaproteobacteria bacterium]|nr:hypothetical protein [Alphaproteobacteria bacterium]
MKPWTVALTALAVTHAAQAAEVQFEGAYQARARLYDTLSLDRTLDNNEGFSWTFQHRLWLRPKFYVTDKVGLFVDILGLDNVFFGDQPVAWIDPVTQVAVPTLFSDDLRPPVSETDPTQSRFDLTLWRAWAEVHTGVGTFKFGRQPLNWGMGLWQNDGIGLNKEYGDTADRVSWEHLIQDIWVRAAFDLNTAGLVNETDQTWSINLAAAYRTERIDGGLNFQYRHSNAADSKFDLFTFSPAFDLKFGIIGVRGEGVFQLGNGDLDGGLNDVRLFGAGFALDASIELDRVGFHLEGGLATGDGDPTDTNLRTFTFDRDYNLGIFMFEQPMPVLESAVPGEARSYAQTLSGNAVSNAGYLKPNGSVRITRGFFFDAALIAAWTAKVSEELKAQGRNGSYGVEIDAGLRVEAIEHLTVGATLGVFVPGAFYTKYLDETYSGFNDVAVGGQIIARVHF